MAMVDTDMAQSELARTHARTHVHQTDNRTNLPIECTVGGIDGSLRVFRRATRGAREYFARV